MKQSLKGVKVLLLDIEGTVCPISFVKDTLFPYALKVLPSILETQWAKPEFEAYKSAFPSEAQQSPDAFLAHVQDLTARDVKIAYLKNLQGYLWESGYKQGAYTTPLFPDITPTIFSNDDIDDINDNDNDKSGSNKHGPARRTIAIYSSGSIFAQKLLFSHSYFNTNTETETRVSSSVADAAASAAASVDLTPQIFAYYDTTTAGPKTEPKSYQTIVGDLMAKLNGTEIETEDGHGQNQNQNLLGRPSDLLTSPRDVLFLSDNVKEIQPALDAGLRAVVVDRPGNATLTSHDRDTYDIIISFDQLQLD